jgi:hypothetical protein
MATYLRDRWRAVPFLFFLGNLGTGKTRALEVAQALADRALLVSSVSAAALFRIDEDFHPTLCLDETEYLSREDRAEIVGLLNSRYRRGGQVIRVGAADKETQKRDVEVFNVFGFTALAGTRGFLQTLESRCIIFCMQKAMRAVPIFIDENEAAELRAKLVKFQGDGFTDPSPTSHQIASGDDFDGFDGFWGGGGVSGRTVELFGPLLAVAPPKAKESIGSFAKDFETRKNEEISASDDAFVYFALQELHKLPSYAEEVPVLVLRDKVNENYPEREGFTAQQIGYALRRLGLRTKRGTAGKRQAVYNDIVMARLALMFGDRGTLQKPSNSSNPAPETKSEGSVTTLEAVTTDSARESIKS